jgi:undecaprenyl-diphosphatase
MRRCTCAALLLLLAAAPARADECDITWSSVDDDFQALLEAPFDMDEEAAYWTLGVTAFTGVSIIWWDDDVDRWVQKQPDSFSYRAMHQFSRLAGWYGEKNTHAIITYAGVIGAVALGGVIADDDYVLDTAALMAEAGAFSFVLNVAVKMVVGRARPHTERGPHAFQFLTSPTNSDMHAILSGHTANAFALAGTAAGRHPHWYVQVPGYLFAAAAGLQRMDSRSHWMSDVVSGAFFGYAIAEFLVDRKDCADGGDDGGSAPMVSITIRF